MTLRRASAVIESGQAETVANAGGSHLYGDFRWTPFGWELILSRLTFQELVQIAEAVRRIVE